MCEFKLKTFVARIIVLNQSNYKFVVYVIIIVLWLINDKGIVLYCRKWILFFLLGKIKQMLASFYPASDLAWNFENTPSELIKLFCS